MVLLLTANHHSQYADWGNPVLACIITAITLDHDTTARAKRFVAFAAPFLLVIRRLRESIVARDKDLECNLYAGCMKLIKRKSKLFEDSENQHVSLRIQTRFVRRTGNVREEAQWATSSNKGRVNVTPIDSGITRTMPKPASPRDSHHKGHQLEPCILHEFVASPVTIDRIDVPDEFAEVIMRFVNPL